MAKRLFLLHVGPTPVDVSEMTEALALGQVAVPDAELAAWWYLPPGSGPHPAICMAHGFGAVKEMFLDRFAQRFCERLAPSRPMRQFNEHELRDVAGALSHWPIVPSGTEGYRTAEVTLGGVDTREVSSSTFESRRVPGLYFIGEVLDVTGWLGGYNFQWAWASAHACAQAL